ncbi:MAG: glycosyltransferase family 39 protein [Anaerolineales bacterium]|nr:glycosyltransferase family 39 protein [Anaerolineales bacterium]
MFFKRTRISFEAGLIILSLLFHLYVIFSPADSLVNWYTSDDAFYYFQVARNVANGLGATFDGINLTNGFHPLWMLVCIPVFSLAKFDLFLPLRLLALISAALNTAAGILLYRLLKKYLSQGVAALTALIWVFTPSFHMLIIQRGMETSISAFFLVLLLFLVNRWRDDPALPPKKSVLLGLVAGLAILARLDNVFVVLLVGVWFVMGTASVYLRTVAVGDLALIFASGMLSYYIRLRAGPFYLQYSASLPWLVGMAFILKPLAFLVLGLYRPPEKRSLRVLIWRSFLAVSSASFVVGAFLLILKGLHVYDGLPRSVVIIDWAGTLVGVIGLRWIALKLFAEKPSQLAVLPSATWFDWRQWKKPILRAVGYFGLVGLLLDSYMSWSYIYVGTAMPVSSQIKRWWSSLDTVYGVVVRNVAELFGFIEGSGPWQLATSPVSMAGSHVETRFGENYASVTMYLVAALLIVIILVLVVSQRKLISEWAERLGLFPLFVGLYAQIFSYTATSYINIRAWYWVGEMLITVICLGLLLESMRLGLQRLGLKVVIWRGLVATIGIWVLLASTNMLWTPFPYEQSMQEERYLTYIRALEKATRPGDLIGMTGGGEVAYFIQGRTIINLDGLINSPEYFRLMKEGQATAYLDQLGLDYVYGMPYVVTVSEPYGSMLAGRMQLIDRIGEFSLYRYNPPAGVAP